MNQAGNFGPKPCHAPPDVFTETVSYQNIRLPLFTNAFERKDGC